VPQQTAGAAEYNRVEHLPGLKRVLTGQYASKKPFKRLFRQRYNGDRLMLQTILHTVMGKGL
jgi:hypothetical protein